MAAGAGRPVVLPPARRRRPERRAGGGREAAPSTFRYDPADPTPTVGGPLLQPPGKQADNRAVEARADVLVFTGPPWPADVDVVGPVRARVHVRPEPRARRRVRPAVRRRPERRLPQRRRRHPPARPADRARRRTSRSATTGSSPWTSSSSRPRTASTAGHRLRLQVSGGAFPRFARNLGTGEPFGTATTGRAGRVEVFHDRAHPSQLELSVLRETRLLPG